MKREEDTEELSIEGNELSLKKKWQHKGSEIQEEEVEEENEETEEKEQVEKEEEE